ncbi:MAG: FGGY-family carbohydrate kinase [Kiritimatiellae bacterium]|nr:FGGY-family carbohydrate kinase [Kiritimatiellia bacterium]
MDLLLGIDLGTSYFKLGLFDRELRLRGLGRVPVSATVDGNRCELASEAFWLALRQGLTTALTEAKASAGEIVALSYSSQANSFLFLDKADRPLTPLIIWTDTRAGELPSELAELSSRPDFLETTGLGVGLSPQMATAKWRWLQHTQPGLWDATAHVLTISDYLAHSLTGQFAGDAGTAALLGLMDQRTLAWWPQAMAAARVQPARLARPLRPGALIGPVSAAGGTRLGLTPGIPMTAGTLDHHAAALGAGVGQEAQASVSLGTVLACVAQSRQYYPRAGVCVLPGVEVGTSAMLAFDNNGAGVLEWYRQRFASDLSFRRLDELAAVVPPDCDGLTAVPQAHTRPGLSGFANRTAAHGHGHHARAIMTSSAVTLGELLDLLVPGERPNRIVATGGGAHSALWLRIISEQLGLTVFPAGCPEPACRGAAMLAARALK